MAGNNLYVPFGTVLWWFMTAIKLTDKDNIFSQDLHEKLASFYKLVIR